MASKSSTILAFLLVFAIVATSRRAEAEVAVEELVVASEGGGTIIELVRSKLLPQAGRCPTFSCQTHNDCYMRGCPACVAAHCLNR